MRIVSILVAFFAALGEATIAYAAHVPVWLIVPLALLSGATILWMAVALAAFARRGRDSAAQTVVETALAAQARRLDRAEARLRLLSSAPDLARAESALTAAAEQIESWEAPARDLPRWTAAFERWTTLAARVHADLAPESAAPSEAEQRSARAELPATRNFSSADLRAAIEYLMQRARIVAAHDRLLTYAQNLDDGDGASTTAS
jgi:hypothetical protein